MDKTLRDVWNAYFTITRNDSQNENFKAKLLELFIHKYYNSEDTQNDENNGVVATSAAPDLCHYLLQNMERVVREAIPLEVDISGYYGDGEDLESVRNRIIDDAKTSAYKKYLLEELGGRILKLMSDIDLRFVTTRRELCHILISTFPSKKWDPEPKDFLTELSQDEIEIIFKTLTILKENSVKKNQDSSKKDSIIKLKPVCLESLNIEEFCGEFEEFTHNTSSLANIIIEIILKLLDCERRTFLRFYDSESVTLSCLDYSLRNLKRLNKEQIFGDRDQFYLKIRITEVLYQSLNNLIVINFSRELVFSTFIQLIGIGDETDDVTVLCGILLATLGLLNNVLVKNVENMKDFLGFFKNSYSIISNMYAKIANGDPEMLYQPQRLLIRIIRNLNLLDNNARKKSLRKRRKKKSNANAQNIIDLHCDIGMKKKSCIFEKLLLETLAMTDQKRNNRMLLKHFHQNKICCCNATIQTVKIIIGLNVLHNYCLHFIKKQILLPMFTIKDLCKKCATKQKSQSFERNFFEILKDSMNFNTGNNLNLLLYHIFKISEILPYQYCNTMLSLIVLPLFWQQKEDYLQDYDEAVKEVVVSCLNIILICIKDIRTVKMFFNIENIKHIRDLSMIPDFGKTCCSLLKIAIENLAHLGESPDEQAMLTELIIEIPCSNILYLIDELANLFSSLKLQKKLNKAVITKKELNCTRHKENFDAMSYKKLVEKSVEEIEPVAGTSKDLMADYYGSPKTENQTKFVPKSTSSPNNKEDLDEFEILDQVPILLNENSKLENLLALSAIHFEMISKLLSTSTKFQKKFIEHIQQFYDNRIFFNLFFNSVESILVTNELEEDQEKSVSVPVSICFESYSSENLKTLCKSNSQQLFKHVGVLSEEYDLSYEKIVENFQASTEYDEIVVSFSQFLSTGEISNGNDNEAINLMSIFKIKQSYDTIISAHPKRRYSESEFFSLFSVSDYQNSERQQMSQVTQSTVYKRFLNNLLTEKQVISEKLYNLFMKIVSLKSDETDQQRFELIQDLRDEKCLRSMYAIVANCLDILFKVYDNENFVSDLNMKSALCELKSLLLEHSDNYWSSIECGNTILSTLQLLIKVAEAKKSACNSTLFNSTDTPSLLMLENVSMDQSDISYIEPLQNGNTDNIFSDVESCEGEVLETIGTKEDTDEEQTTEENYITADESYDADEEFFSYSDTDSLKNQDALPVFCSESSLHYFVGHNTNQSICHLVVEILMELCNKCIQNRNFWINNLKKLAKRLCTLKSFLGSSTFLLKGFFPILKLNDPELAELQLGILELVNYLDTPDSYAAFLSILATEDPPVDLLLPRFTSLCQTSIRPFAEIEYPTEKSEEIDNSSCSQGLQNILNDLIANHKSQEADSPFTESSQIVSLEKLDFQLWNLIGFTVSTWIQLKSDYNDKLVEHEMKMKESTGDDLLLKKSIHLVSVGSEKLMVSVYLNYDKSLSLNVFAPDEKTKENQRTLSKIANLIPSTSKKTKKLVTAREDLNESSSSRTNKENMNNSNFFGIALATLKSPGSPKVYTRGFLKKRDKSRSQAPVSSKRQGKPINLLRKPWKSKQLRVQSGKWTHLTISVRNTKTHIVILLTMDGLEQEIAEFPITISEDLEKCQKIQVMCIGSSSSSSGSEEKLKYSISNILLFRTAIEMPSMLANLCALGPDCSNFIMCQTGNPIFNYGILSLHKNIYGNIQMANSRGHLKQFRSLLKLCYSADNANVILGYRNEKIDYGEKLSDIYSLGMYPKSVEIPSIYRTLILSGGLSSLLFFFARVVELSENPSIYASALYILLKIAYSNNELCKEFEEKQMFNLVAHVFKSRKCAKGPEMLKAIIDVACGVSLINRTPENVYQLVSCTNLSILHPRLIFDLLEHYNIFEQNNVILDLFLGSLFLMINNTHQNYKLNLNCLIDHGFLDKLLLFCEVNFTDTNNTIAISKLTATSIVALIRSLITSPPSMGFLKKLVKLFLLLHPSIESFVTHDRSKFFFILPANRQTRSKRILPALNRKLGFNSKIRDESSSASSSSSVYIEPFNDERMEQFKQIQKELSSSESMLSGTSKSKTSKSLASSKKIKKLDELNEREQILINEAFVRGNLREKFLKRPAKSSTPNKLLKRGDFRNRRLSLANLYRKPSPKKTKNQDAESVEIESEVVKQFEDMMLKNSESYTLDKSSSSEILSACDTNEMAGIYLLQESFILMMYDFIVTLPDDQIRTLLENHLKLEILIVLANHKDPNVRAAIIRLITVVLDRSDSEKRLKYFKLNYWIHLGNQLTIYPVSAAMVQACMDWIGRGSTSMDSLRNLDVATIQKEGLVPLIAILPHVVNDPHLFVTTIKYLQFLIENSPDCFQYMLENGLVAAAIKSVINLSNPHEKCMQGIYKILKIIAFKTLTSVGSIKKLWDLLYGLSYEEKMKKSLKIREAHIYLLNTLLKALVQQHTPNRRLLFKRTLSISVNLENCNLQPSEIKTRFNLIFERAVQFIVSSDLDTNLSANELQLIDLITSITLCGFTQGSSILLWALSPTKPVELKCLVIKQLYNLIKDGFSLQIDIEQKLIRCLSLNFLQSQRHQIPPEDLPDVEKFCENLGSSPVQMNLLVSQALDKIESIKALSSKEEESAIEKSIYKHEHLVQNCIEVAMKITREVIDIQNQERRFLIGYIKKLQEMDFHREWIELIQRMTHEGAPWYNQDLYSNCWELDPTEGPDRCRKRLKRTTLKIAKRFFLDQFSYKADYQNKRQLLSFLQERNENDEKYSIGDQIIYTFSGKYLTLDQEIKGDIIITDTQLLFLAFEDVYNNSIICSITDILEIWERKYQHKEIGMEFYLNTSRSFLLILESNYDRELVKQFFTGRVNASSEFQKLNNLVQQWRDGLKTNFEFLMELNKLAGRSYNDLMQYPVFPWILSNYESSVLNLFDEDSYRNLEKTIATQHKDSENHYMETYRYLEQTAQDEALTVLKPYHYSSHYSNSGTVLHFLVRIPPFTSMFLLYQDNNFDLPDRTFHSLATTYRLASKDSATDVKELVPEFFCLPEMLENIEGFNFGRRQNGAAVNDVHLPEWCNGSSRLFTLIHRQALESDYVRSKLNNWIDLIFGYKQKGSAAIAAINVFHPVTYPEFQLSAVSDVVDKQAYETMIRTYGQMPKQIFTNPAPKSKVPVTRTIDDDDVFTAVLQSVRGLRWGHYTGSPHLPSPRIADFHQKLSTKINRIVCNAEENLIHGLPDKCSLIEGTNNSLSLVLHGIDDNIVRIKSLTDINENVTCLFHISSADQITVCGSHYKHQNIWFGYKSGKICVFTRNGVSSSNLKREKSPKNFYDSKLESIIGIKNVNSGPSDVEMAQDECQMWNSPITLVRHCAEIVDIKICVEYSIVVSIGNDKRTVIWDANRLEYIRTIEPPCNTLDSNLSLVAVSPTLGDIVTIFTPKNETPLEMSSDESESFEVMENNADDFLSINMKVEKSQLRLHTINAKYVNHRFTDERTSAVCYSAVKEGTGVNAIVVGFNTGIIRFYSSWNLDFFREIIVGNSAIECLLFSTYHYLVVLTNGNLIQVFESASDEITGKLPKFNNIVPMFFN